MSAVCIPTSSLPATALLDQSEFRSGGKTAELYGSLAESCGDDGELVSKLKLTRRGHTNSLVRYFFAFIYSQFRTAAKQSR
jgi:hypothetical protein